MYRKTVDFSIAMSIESLFSLSRYCLVYYLDPGSSDREALPVFRNGPCKIVKCCIAVLTKHRWSVSTSDYRTSRFSEKHTNTKIVWISSEIRNSTWFEKYTEKTCGTSF